jgi:hypothetical protein
MSNAVNAALLGDDYDPGDDQGSPNGHGPKPMRRVELGDQAARPAKRPAVHEGLIYPRKLHVVGGEPGHGKSTVVLWWLLTAMARGHPVVFFDWEAGAEHTADLLRSFGAEPAAIDKYLHYYPHPELDWQAITAEIQAVKPVIVAFDSAIAILSAMGGNENNPSDIRRMWSKLTVIAHRLGPAVVATDHSGKDAAESRYNRGSTDKLAVVDVSMKLHAVQQFSRHRDGKLELEVTKDRPGWLHWNWAVTVTRDPLLLNWRETTGQAASRDAPGGAVGSVLAALNDEPADIKRIVDRIVARGGYPLKPNTAKKALLELAERGRAEALEQGPGQPTLWCKTTVLAAEPQHPDQASLV